MTLREMHRGQRGEIVAITVQGELGLRLREMGLTRGTVFRVEGRAPLYDPVMIKVAGQTLTLRNNEADYIEVKLLADD